MNFFNVLGNWMEDAPEQVSWNNVQEADFNQFWNPARYQGMQDKATALGNKANDYGLGGRAEQELFARQDKQFKQFSGLTKMKGAGLLGEAMGSVQRQLASQGIGGTASNAMMKTARNDAMKKIGDQNYQSDASFLLNQGAQTESALNSIHGIGASYDNASADMTKNFYGMTQNEMVSRAQEKNRVGIANSQGLLQAAMQNATANTEYKNRWANMFNDFGNGLNNMAFNMAGKAVGGMV